MQVRCIYVSVKMSVLQFALLAKKAASRGVYLSYARGVVAVPLKIGRPLANAYARRIVEVDAELAKAAK